MASAWPTLDEYTKYENLVVSGLGLHTATFLKADEVAERHTAFRVKYTDEGDNGGPAVPGAAHAALLKMLSDQHEVFTVYYRKMRQAIGSNITARQLSTDNHVAPPAPVQEVSFNEILHEMGLCEALTQDEMDVIHDGCRDYLSEACNVKASRRPNNVTKAATLTCNDYHIPKNVESDLREAISLQCVTVIRKRGRPSVRTLPPPETKKNDAVTSDDVDDRIRIGDVLESMESEFPEVDFFDPDVLNDIKMKVGSMMLSEERRKRTKRARDEMGRRVYTETDRDSITRYSRMAFTQHMKKHKSA